MDSAGQYTGTQQGQSFDPAGEGVDPQALAARAEADTAGAADVAQPAGHIDEAAALRSYIPGAVVDLLQGANRAASELKWNPDNLAAAYASLAAVEAAAQMGRAVLDALAALPPEARPGLTPEEAHRRALDQQQAAASWVRHLIWELQGYADLIERSPLNTPALLAMEQSLNTKMAETHRATFGLGVAIREARSAG